MEHIGHLLHRASMVLLIGMAPFMAPAQDSTFTITPRLLLDRIERARDRVASLDRLRLQLDPRAPLRRGYVLVTDDAGAVVKTRAAAKGMDSLLLEFEDGKLHVRTDKSGQGRAAAPRRSPRKGAEPRQDDLFG